MDKKQVEKMLLTTHYDKDVKVCETTEAEWKQNVRVIYTVESRSRLHEDLVREFYICMGIATHSYDNYLIFGRTLYVEGFNLLPSDCSFRPSSKVGAILPPSLKPCYFDTIKVEIGVTRGWNLLNAKVRQYKLFPVVDGVIEGYNPVDTPPIDILNPTLIFLDSRRVLALRDNVPRMQSIIR
ncbi:hypothetical protein THRCLA_10468 [Thraustotheca clavata]|uniref:Uncharacterized protein n=1 Tax=Thraustotheca clavata TaxID=74557 RepID=A0A1V9YNS9_9STRA|nr:hypothetical protein THRCLA_10468 [Thraustotheca clavata]